MLYRTLSIALFVSALSFSWNVSAEEAQEHTVKHRHVLDAVRHPPAVHHKDAADILANPPFSTALWPIPDDSNRTYHVTQAWFIFLEKLEEINKELAFLFKTIRVRSHTLILYNMAKKGTTNLPSFFDAKSILEGYLRIPNNPALPRSWDKQTEDLTTKGPDNPIRKLAKETLTKLMIFVAENPETPVSESFKNFEEAFKENLPKLYKDFERVVNQLKGSPDVPTADVVDAPLNVVHTTEIDISDLGISDLEIPGVDVSGDTISGPLETADFGTENLDATIDTAEVSADDDINVDELLADAAGTGDAFATPDATEDVSTTSVE